MGRLFVDDVEYVFGVGDDKGVYLWFDLVLDGCVGVFELFGGGELVFVDV